MLISFRTPSPFRGLPVDIFEHTNNGCTLGQQAFIYGKNGSGKTSLSEVLRIHFSQNKSLGGIEANVVQSGSSAQVRISPENPPFEVHVYNRFYVAENLSSFLDASDFAPGLVYAGSGAIELKTEIEASRKALEDDTARRARIESTKRKAEGEIDAALRKAQTEIISHLSASDPAKYSTQSFTRRNVTKLLDGQRSSLEPNELERALIDARRSSPAKITRLTTPVLDNSCIPSLLNKGLLSEIPKQESIDELSGNVPLQHWVEQGLDFHSPDDDCQFCMSSKLTADRLEALRSHFSEEYEASRAKARQAQSQLDSYQAGLEIVQQSLATLEGLDWMISESIWNLPVEEAKRYLLLAVEANKQGLNHLSKKEQDPSSPQTWEVEDSTLGIDLSATNSAIDLHNTQVGKHSDIRRRAQQDVENHEISLIQPMVGIRRDRISRLDAITVAIRSREDQCESRISELNGRMSNTAHLAKLINDDVRYVFGHHSLRVDTSADGKGYVVSREGAPAENLSEGERNAISYSYFLRSLETSGVDRGRAVVVVDDPVTSLDKDALFASYALTLERLSGVLQLVILTHDFDYFRLLLRTPTPNRKLPVTLSDSVKEVDKDKVFPRQVALELVPPSGSKPRHLRTISAASDGALSEYHYLFNLVARAVHDAADGDDLLLYVNAGRRLLEGFIAFRAPQKAKFQDRIDYVAESCAESISPHLKTRIVKFLHSGSHREDPMPDSSLDFSGTTGELCLLLEFMAMADPTHFEAMCLAVAIDSNDLLKSITGDI